MRFEHYSQIESFSDSVVVETDEHGRIWLGFPVRAREENVLSPDSLESQEGSRVDPGYLGRDGEWW